MGGSVIDKVTQCNFDSVLNWNSHKSNIIENGQEYGSCKELYKMYF